MEHDIKVVHRQQQCVETEVAVAEKPVAAVTRFLSRPLLGPTRGSKVHPWMLESPNHL